MSDLIALVESDIDHDSYTKVSVDDVIGKMQAEINNKVDELASVNRQLQEFINAYQDKNAKWRRMVEANMSPKVYSSFQKLKDIGDRNTLAQVVGSDVIYEWSDGDGWHKANEKEED